jgi:fatty acid desaturase
MNFFFDYIFFRVAKFYSKWDEGRPMKAVLAVVLIEFFLISDLVLFFLRLTVGIEGMRGHVKLVKWIVLGTFFVLIVYNYRKYYHNYDKYKDHWAEESPRAKKNRGYLVLLSIVLPLIIFIAIVEFLR